MVKSNKQAFEAIGRRLKDDVGFLLMCAKEKKKTPNWAILRALFPVAESIAALVFPQEERTSYRLAALLREKMSHLNPNYAKLSEIICLIWRHGLTHTDEPPRLIYWGKRIEWSLSMFEGLEHLSFNRQHLTKITPTGQQDFVSEIAFHFVIDQFYEDLKRLCSELATQYPGRGPQQAIYNSWFERRVRPRSRSRGRVSKSKMAKKPTDSLELRAARQIREIYITPPPTATLVTIEAEMRIPLSVLEKAAREMEVNS